MWFLQIVFSSLGYGHKKDFTMWDMQVDSCSSPFTRDLLGNVVDKKGNIIHLYPDSRMCLSLLQSVQIPMAIASRISDSAGAYQLLHLFEIRDFFEFIEIYPTGKGLHFRRINKKSGIKFEDMVFYDDDQRNIRHISKFGVDCVLVEKGLTTEHLDPLLNLASNV